MRDVCQIERRARPVIIGEGRLRADLEAEAAATGLGDAVCFAGFRRDVLALIRGFEIFAFPSTQEALGTSILDAMALRKPVVATLAGGIPETVQDGITGLLVPPGDPRALAKALVTMLQKPERARSIGEAGRRRVKNISRPSEPAPPPLGPIGMSSTKVHHGRSVELEDLRRILLIRLSSLGDVLLMTPLLKLLQHACPHAEIDVLTRFEYRDLLRSHPAITRLLTFESDQPLRHTLSALRVNTYELALDLHCTLRSQLLLRMVRGRRKLTYNKRVLRRALLVRLGWNTLRNSTPVPELYAAPLRRLGLEGHLGPPTMHLDYDSVKAAKDHIARSLPGTYDQPLLAVAPGARWPTKRWPVERFAAAAQALARETDAAVVVLGGADESELASTLCNNLDVPVINVAGTLPLMQSAAMLSRCRLLISNDSGLMHMATALRVPVVAIFGPTVQEFGFFPFKARAEVISEPLSCRPCSTKGSMRCPRIHHACMQDVSSTRVLAVARNLWKSNNE